MFCILRSPFCFCILSHHLEFLFLQAEFELQAARAIIESKAWEPLVEKAAEEQWKWPIAWLSEVVALALWKQFASVNLNLDVYVLLE